jgi:glycine oxidase
MKQSADVIIVGGGIVGCSIAFALRKQGLSALVLERDTLGSQASGAAVGLLAPIRPLCHEDAFKTLQLAGIERFASLVPELESISGIAMQYQRTGTLRILPADKVPLVLAWAEEWQKKGYIIEVLPPESVSVREPLLCPGLAGAVFIADEAQVTPVLAVKAYAQAARNLGAIFYEHTEVVTVQRAEPGSKVTGVWTNQGDFLSCHHLVIATGAWSAAFGEQLGVTIPVRPVRGELIALKPPSNASIRHIIFDEGIWDVDWYITPKPDGTVIIGATKVEAGFDETVSAGGALHLLEIATKIVPSLANWPIVRIWAGLRPKSIHSRPLLGPAPLWENVTVATGHGGFGITLSAITGDLIAEWIATRQISDLMAAFVPA